MAFRKIPWYLTLKYQRQWYSTAQTYIPPSPKRVLILGARGMLGHVVEDLYRRNQWIEIPEVYGAYREQDGDLADEKNYKALLDKFHPDFVVNCTGVLIQKSQENHLEAVRVNAMLPWMALRFSIEYNYKLIHVSTDCVFKGRRKTAEPQFYKRNSLKDAESWYGMTKSLGELLSWGDNPGDEFFKYRGRFLTVRTSIIGPELVENGTGLFHWAMRYQNPIIQGYQVLWNGVTTYHLARFIIKESYKPEYGILRHLTAPLVSKYKLLDLIGSEFSRNWFVVEKADSSAGAKLLAPSKVLRPLRKPMNEQLKELKMYMYSSPYLETYQKLYGEF